MTRLKKSDSTGPVFVKPPAAKGQKQFLTRRFLGLAGKPLLAEKHIPIKPSESDISRKCFSASAEKLYKQCAPSPIAPLKTACNLNAQQCENLVYSDFYALPEIKNTPGQLALIGDTNMLSPQKGYYQATQNQSFQKLPCCCKIRDKNLLLCREPSWQLSEADHKRLATIYELSDEKAIKQTFVAVSDNAFFAPAVFNKRFAPVIQTLHTVSGYFYKDKSLPQLKDIKQRLIALAGNMKAYETAASYTGYNSSPERFDKLEASIKHIAGSFEQSVEIVRNLVLEQQIKDFPVFLNHQSNTACSTSQLCNKQIYLSAAPNFAFKNFQTESFSLPAMALQAQSKMANKADRRLKCESANLKANDKRADMHFSRPMGFAKSQSSDRSKLRLKLHLHRQPFPDVAFKMQTLEPRAKAAITSFSSVIVKITEPQLIKTTPAPPTFAYLADKHKLTDPMRFCRKRSALLIKTTSHAKYTARCMKKLRVSDAFTKSKRRDCGSASNLIDMSRPGYKPVEYFHSRVSKTSASNETILLRPMTFLMYISAPEFTNISLPLWRRRLKAPAGLFNSPSNTQIRRRKDSLRTLKFRLQKIVNGYKSGIGRAQTKIPFKDIQLEPYREVQNKLASTQFCKLESVNNEKQVKFTVHPVLEAFTITLPLPAQLAESLPLAHALAGSDAPKTLQQKTFIHPPLWKLSQKDFKCRLRLMPYPFGFPEFRLPSPSFACLCHSTAFLIPEPSLGKAFAASNYILQREKSYLPPLSMKNPRRFLFPPVGASIMTGNLFAAAAGKGTLKLKTAAEITEFIHPWEIADRKVLRQTFSGQLFLASKRSHLCNFMNLSTTTPPLSFIVHDESAATPDMPRIKRLLLRARRFALNKHNPELGLSTGSNRKHSQFPLRHAEFKEALFSDRCEDFTCFSAAKDHDMSYCFFGAPREPLEVTINYQARFRVFRFPYRPGKNLPIVVPAVFSDNTDTTITQHLTAEDDLRAKIFAFNFQSATALTKLAVVNPQQKPADLSGRLFAPQKPDNKIMSLKEPSLAIETGTIIARGTMGQFVNPDTFFKPRCKNATKLLKLRKVYTFLHQKSVETLASGKETFSEWSMKNAPPHNLNMDSVHWIILLRSHISITKSSLKYPAFLINQSSEHSFGYPLSETVQPFFFSERLFKKKELLGQPQKEQVKILPSGSAFSQTLYQTENTCFKTTEKAFSFSATSIKYSTPNLVEKTYIETFYAGPCEKIKHLCPPDLIIIDFEEPENTPGKGFKQRMLAPANTGVLVEKPNFRFATAPDWIETLRIRPKLRATNQLENAA